MRNKTLYFVIILIVLSASYFASSSPDGLEFVAKKLGFLNKGLIGNGIMTNSLFPAFGHDPLSTSLRGLLGVLVILGVFSIITKLLTK